MAAALIQGTMERMPLFSNSSKPGTFACPARMIELWEARELLWTLMRELRYKQSFLGALGDR